MSKGGCDNFAGRANKRITIQEKTETPDAYGANTVSWTDTEISAWAIIEPQSGREVFRDGKTQSRVDSKMTIRYNALFKSTAAGAKYRVSFDSRIFNILYVKNIDEDLKREGQAFQMLVCEENAPITSG